MRHERWWIYVDIKLQYKAISSKMLISHKKNGDPRLHRNLVADHAPLVEQTIVRGPEMGVYPSLQDSANSTPGSKNIWSTATLMLAFSWGLRHPLKTKWFIKKCMHSVKLNEGLYYYICKISNTKPYSTTKWTPAFSHRNELVTYNYGNVFLLKKKSSDYQIILTVCAKWILLI